MANINLALASVAWTWSLINMPMKVHTDIVFDNSGSDEYGSDKCGYGMVSDDPDSDNRGSDQCTLIWSDNCHCDKCNWPVWLWHEIWLCYDSNKVPKAVLPSDGSGYLTALLGMTYPSHQVYCTISYPRYLPVQYVLSIITAQIKLHGY